MTDEIARLRARLAEIDERILEAAAERQAVVRELGRIKAEAGRPARDFEQEAEVVHRARETAVRLGLDPEIAEGIILDLIRASLTVQERDRVRAAGSGSGRRALIIGGAGKMGRWFARFMASQGFEVEVADPAGPVEGFTWVEDWRSSRLDHEMIVVAAPLAASGRVLQELAEREPTGLVFDLGSLKTPLREGLHALSSAGVAVASIHPMFGPDTELLSGRHVIFVDVGDPEAVERVRALFASTMASQVEMDLDSHDRLIAFVLGLSHALNVAFFTALAESGEAATQLARLSSTTFDAQLDVARRVAGDNPFLYFEIQSLNEYGGDALAALAASVDRIRSAVEKGDAAAFTALMERGQEYLRTVGERRG